MIERGGNGGWGGRGEAGRGESRDASRVGIAEGREKRARGAAVEQRTAGRCETRVSAGPVTLRTAAAGRWAYRGFGGPDAA